MQWGVCINNSRMRILFESTRTFTALRVFVQRWSVCISIAVFVCVVLMVCVCCSYGLCVCCSYGLCVLFLWFVCVVLMVWLLVLLFSLFSFVSS